MIGGFYGDKISAIATESLLNLHVFQLMLHFLQLQIQSCHLKFYKLVGQLKNFLHRLHFILKMLIFLC